MYWDAICVKQCANCAKNTIRWDIVSDSREGGQENLCYSVSDGIKTGGSPGDLRMDIKGVEGDFLEDIFF